MATQADHIEFVGRTSAFQRMIADDCKYHDDAYHRKIAYAAKIKKRLANPYGKRLNLRVDKMWAARQVAKAIVESAAAELAAAKAMRRAEEIYAGMFQASGTVAGGQTGWNMDG